jgi:xanthine dehydrogenase accessory factor
VSEVGADSLRRAREALEREGRSYAHVRVVWRRAPSGAHPGDEALVTAEGELRGWIGGACAGPAVIREALRALREGRPRVLCLGTKHDFGPPDASRTVLETSCSGEGALELFIEPHSAPARLWVLGDAPAARALAELAARVGFAVERHPGVPPDAERERICPQTYAVVAGFGGGDPTAVHWLLESPADYVACIASRRRAAVLREQLRERGVAESDLARLHSPAGLDLGALRHEEIAVAVLAELVSLRAARAQRAAETPALELLPEEDPAAEDELIDPVCGMRVTRASLRAEHAGEAVYFCGPRCRERFSAQPHAYVPSEADPD